MEDFKTKLEKHRFHIKKLETLLRMLDNMSVEVEQVGIKESAHYNSYTMTVTRPAHSEIGFNLIT